MFVHTLYQGVKRFCNKNVKVNDALHTHTNLRPDFFTIYNSCNFLPFFSTKNHKKKQTSLLLSFFLLKLNHVEQTPLPMDNVIKNPAKSNLIFVLQYNLFSWCTFTKKKKIYSSKKLFVHNSTVTISGGTKLIFVL